MGLFEKINQCPFKAQCPMEEGCSHVADSNYQDCNLYEDWSGGGVNENNACPYKDECSLYPFNCLWGEYPRDCFHYSTFARKHGDILSYDDDDDTVDDNDDSTTSFDTIFAGDSHKESEPEKSVRIATKRRQPKQNKELDIAKKQAKLERTERRKKKGAERQTAKQKHRELLNDSKNYLVASLLAIFLGWLGAHKFYIGKYMSGVIYLVFCWAWIPGILGIIQGLKWLSKGQDEFIDELADEWDS